MNSISTDKITEQPVFDTQLESKILKTILLDKNNICLFEKLADDDFYNQSNKKIYHVFKSIINETGMLDIDLIPASIKTSDEFKVVIFSEVLFNWELSVYIDKLKKITNQRKIQRLALEATVKIKEDRNPNEITEWLTEEFSKMITPIPEDIGKQNLRINSQLFEELQRDDYFGLTSGYPTLDNRIRGFANGTLTILGGTPSSGKTTWLLNIVNHLCKQGKRVLHVNLEVSHVMLQMKILSIITSIPTTILMSTKKNISESDWKYITETLNTMANYKWFRIGEKDITVNDIDIAIKEHGGFDIVFVDYLQLLKTSGRKSRYEEISEISRSLKKLATKHNIPVFVIASINRNYATRENKMPTMADLRDSGAIEYDADLILFLNRPCLFDEYDEKEYHMTSYEFEHYSELLIAKNRWGASNKKIPFYFDGEKSIFKEMVNGQQRIE